MEMRRPASENHSSDRSVMPSMGGGGWVQRLLAIVLLVAGLLVIAFFVDRAFNHVTADQPIKSKEYQAVFLTNGQVYFGKLTQSDSDYVKLTDIYYLQVQQSVQPGSTSTTANNANQQVSLAKLGGELHGPEDVMYVSRQQVLFWENLKTDGKVTKAIADYQSSGGK